MVLASTYQKWSMGCGRMIAVLIIFAVVEVTSATPAETKANDPTDSNAYQQVSHAGGSIAIASPHEGKFPAHLESEEPKDDDHPTVSRSQPKINLIGPSVVNVPVLRTESDRANNEYRDMGAKCVDEVDGQSGHGEYPLIEVAGEVHRSFCFL